MPGFFDPHKYEPPYRRDWRWPPPPVHASNDSDTPEFNILAFLFGAVLSIAILIQCLKLCCRILRVALLEQTPHRQHPNSLELQVINSEHRTYGAV